MMTASRLARLALLEQHAERQRAAAASEAALCYARHVGAARAAAEAAEAWGEGPPPLSAAEARATAAAEGLELVPSGNNATGFKGVHLS